MSKQKLELTWVGKDKRPRLEPRILLEDPASSYHATHRVSESDIFDNRLIFGDNLLALKALEQEFSGKVKCIYIDPPYNTGQAFEYYDDGVEASLWLSLMRERLAILARLLRDDGVIFVQIDDGYFAHLKIIMDEVFGVNGYINTIAVRTKGNSGASGGGEDRRLKKNIEFVLAYGGKEFECFNEVYSETELEKYLELMRIEGRSFKYTSVLYNSGHKHFVGTIKDGAGNDMKLFKVEGYETRSLSRIAKDEGITDVEVIYKYYDKVHTTENAQTSIRTRVQDATDSMDNMYALEYVPVSGRSKGLTTELLFVGPQKRLVSWFRNVTLRKGKKIVKREKLGTFWEDLNWNNVTREGGVRFPNGQKPERLVSLCLELATMPGDLVLDSFLGSGTTAAVAQKMKRRWIGVELGEHCNTHCVPRLKGVIDGTDQSGVSALYSWSGGGGFRYYKLAPTLIVNDRWGNPVINPEYNSAMLAEALAKLEGFSYAPSEVHWWQHGHSSERDFIYVTTQNLSAEHLQGLADEVGAEQSLLVCCAAFHGLTAAQAEARWPNLTLKKIPKMVLSRCEWGHDDYSLNVASLPQAEQPLAAPELVKSGRKGKVAAPKQAGLFGED